MIQVHEMTSNLNTLVSNQWLNGWRLFWLVTTPVSIIMIIAMLRIESWSDGHCIRPAGG